MAEQRVIVEGTYGNVPLPVSGTLTTAPSGTQNVAITGQPILISGTVASLAGIIPNFTGAYIASFDDIPGVVALNNYLSLFNPIGSGKKMYYLGAYISTYVASGGSTTRQSMQGHAITAASGGTLSSASSIFKLDSTYPNASAEVRTANPTVTLGANVFNSPPPIGTTVGQYVHAVGLGFGTFGGPVIFRPGEGVVFTSDAGNINQTWNLSIGWAEST